MPTLDRLRPLVLSCVLGASACSDIGLHEQELRVRHLAADDALELLVITQGLEHSTCGPRPLFGPQPTLEQALERGARRVEAMAGGKRWFHLFPYPFDLDLDRLIEEGVDPAADELEGRCVARFLELARGITVTGAAAFIDDEGRLGVWQRVRVPEIAALVDLANECGNADYARKLEQVAGADPDARLAHLRSDCEFLDAESAQLWLAHVEDNRAWFRFDGEQLLIEIPITRACFERQVTKLLNGVDLASSEDTLEAARCLGHVLAQAEAIEFATTGVRLTFAPLEGHALVLRTRQIPGEWDARLLEALRERGLEPEALDLERLRAQFGSTSGVSEQRR